MADVKTVFGSIEQHEQGGVHVVGDDSARRYLFSNLFEVAKNANPYERIVVAKNLDYVVEVVRAEGDSPWWICAHAEAALLMQGTIETHFIKPSAGELPSPEQRGAVRLAESPTGTPMGFVRSRRGHMTRLPGGAAYQFRPSELSVILIQTVLGDESVEKWAEVCQH